MNKSLYSKILVVDDLEVNLKLLSEILRKNKISVQTTNSGKEAIKLAQEINPDLILLDIAMPETDGFEVCKQLKNNTDTENIPVIFLTARNQTEDIVKGLKMGAVDYLTKPYKSQELVSRINTHLDLKRAKDIINRQNQELVQINQQLTKSLHYARHIQDKLMPNKKLLSKALKDHFIFYHPKHIVSGDFYWLTEIDNLVFLSAIDYTGHGMPGALMSMIGNTLLNEIIINRKIFDPGKILHILNQEVIKTLSKDAEENEDDNNGDTEVMDISLCVIDKKKNEVRLSCANQNVYYFKQDSMHKIEGQIISIGRSFPKNQNISFKTHTIKIDKPTYFYLLTDGFQDQFGGPNNKKYQIQNIEKSIAENYKQPFPKQKEILEKKFKEWKAESEQTDDILVIGFKVDL